MSGYTMKETLAVADQAAIEIEAFLREKPETIAVINVEDDEHFRKRGIDLLWIYKFNGKEFMKRVEIKGDRYDHTGNYFIETVSNKEKNTEGCFLYTKADFFFYYFIDTKELNIIPMPLAREWFLANEHRFKKKETHTEVEVRKKFYKKVRKGFYTTIGRLVPKNVLNKEVKGVKVVFIKEKQQKAG